MTRFSRMLLAGVLTLVCSTLATAADVGVSESPKGWVLQRPSGEKAWQLVDANQKLPAESLILALPGGKLDSANGAVRLTFRTDLSGTSPYPIAEAAVILHENPKYDLDLTLDRGRIDLTNQKTSGPARVHVRVRDVAWDLTLEGPKSRVALELYGRWPRGAQFTKEPGPKDVPSASLIFLVLNGEVERFCGQFEHPLTAPPGPALMEWSSEVGNEEAPRKLEKLPDWAQPAADDTPLAKEKRARIEKFARLLVEKSLDEAVETLLNSDDAGDRRGAVLIVCALDDLPHLGKILRETKHHDVWDNAVLSLRHWIGRGPGQDQKLYKGLMGAGFTDLESETILQLLHSYGDDDLDLPETYQTLIAYLNHDKLPIRGLAYWHLVRLAPAGKDFGYHPWDDREARAAAIMKWKQLIQPGKLPPRPTATDVKK